MVALHSGGGCANLAIVSGQVVADPAGVVALDVDLDVELDELDEHASAFLSVSEVNQSGLMRSGAAMIGCAAFAWQTHMLVASVGRRPQYQGQLEVRGLMTLVRFSDASSGAPMVRVAGLVTGLERGIDGMWHIHEGFACGGDGPLRLYDVQSIRPALYMGTGWGYWTSRSLVRGLDPWTRAMYRSDAHGVARVDVTYTLDSPDAWTPLARRLASDGVDGGSECGATLPPVFLGRQVVFHMEAGIQAACGTLGGSLPGISDATVLTERYPAYDGLRLVQMTARLSASRSSDWTAANAQPGGGLDGWRLRVEGVITGLEPNASGTWRVHAGYDCLRQVDKRGQQYPFDVGLPYPGNAAPSTELLWAGAEWHSDADGNAWVDWQPGPALTLREVLGRVLLVSLADGSRAACGHITPSSALTAVVQTPSMRGLVLVAQASSGLLVHGTLIGVTKRIGGEARANGTSGGSSGSHTPLSPASEHVAPASGTWHIGGCDRTRLGGGPFAADDSGVIRLSAHLPSLSIDGSPSRAARGRSLVLLEGYGSNGNESSSNGSSALACSELLGPQPTEIPAPAAALCAGRGLRRSVVGWLIVIGCAAALLVKLSLLLHAEDVAGVIGTCTRVRRASVTAKQVSLRLEASLEAGTRMSVSAVQHVARQATRCRTPSLSDRSSASRESMLLPAPALERRRLGFARWRHGRHSQAAQAVLQQAVLQPDERRPRLLALHGAGANNEVTRRQLHNLGLGEPDFEVVYLQAEVTDEGANLDLDGLVPGPFYRWIRDESTASEVVAVLARVLTFIERHGPFDALFGFSQGGTLLAALMQSDVLELVLQARPESWRWFNPFGAMMPADRDGLRRAPSVRNMRMFVRPTDPEEAHVSPQDARPAPPAAADTKLSRAPSLRAVRASGAGMVGSAKALFGSRTHLVAQSRTAEPLRAVRAVVLGHASSLATLRRLLELPERASTAVIGVASVHIIGTKDALKASSERVAAAFASGMDRVVLYHASAHAIPREVQVNVLLRTRMMAHLDRALHAAAQAESEAGGVELISSKEARRTTVESADEARSRTSQPLQPSFGHAGHAFAPGGMLRVAGAEHLILPAPRASLLWKDVSSLSSIAVAPSQQLVRCRLAEPLEAKPKTIRALLEAWPADTPCLRDAAHPAAASAPCTTYGQLLAFLGSGGAGDLAPLGVTPGHVVAYAAPPGCVAAVAFLTIAAQCTAAPLDPAITQADAASALQQLEAKHVVLFDGVKAEGLQRAAAAIGSVSVHTASATGARTPGLFTLTPAPAPAPAIQPPADAEPQPAGIELRSIDHSRATPVPRLRKTAGTRPADVVLLLRTSGTTSTPKAVPLQQEALVTNAICLASTLGISSSDVCLNVMPLYQLRRRGSKLA